VIKANKLHKELVVNLLHDAFIDVIIPNSINYTIKPGKNRSKRMKVLMSYQFDMALKYGEIFLNYEKTACILYINKITFNLINVIWNFNLVYNCIGFENIFKTLKRENLLKKQHPKIPFKHLWLMAVSPDLQLKGYGSALLQETLKHYENNLVYVETTIDDNVDFYKKNGFFIFNGNFELNYPLYFMKRYV
jgi:hypothetical protein